MIRHRRLRRWAAIASPTLVVAAALVVHVPPAAATATSTTNPVSPVGLAAANPSVLRDVDGTYYAYLNGVSGSGDGTGAVPVLTSTDLATWSAAPNALVTPAPWTSTTATSFTSPSVARYAGNAPSQRYVLYYTGTKTGTSTKCIGVATSASASGPFTDTRTTPLICGGTGARDPSILQGLKPQLIHYEAAATNGIYNQVLSDDGLSTSPSLPAPYLLRSTGTWWQESAADRPAVVVGGGAPYLFYGGAPRTTGRHAVGWANCDAPYGVVVGCSNRTYPSPVITTTDSVESPGGVQPFTDAAGRSWLAYDALPAGSCGAGTCTGTRSMRIDKLCFGPEGPRTTAPTSGTQPLARSATCSVDIPSTWVATAASAIVEYGASWTSGNTFPSFNQQTLRQGAHATVAGSAVRVHLSNRLGSSPLVIDGASVGVSTTGSGNNQAIAPGSLATLTFGGRSTVTVDPGDMVTSDVTTLDVPADHDLAVNLFFAANSGAPNGTIFGGQTSWRGGLDRTAQTSAGGFTQSRSSVAIVSGVDVLSPQTEGALVVIGDSKTDGYLATAVDEQERWTDRLSARFVAAERNVAVDNVASAGNQILPVSGDLSSGTGRFGRDVLGRTGARSVIIALGTNDVLGGATESQIAAGIQATIDKARADGLRVLGATIPPIGGPRGVSGCTDTGDPNTAQNNVRKAINDRIRPGAADSFDVDGVVDLDKALRDPGALDRIKCEYANFIVDLAGVKHYSSHANATGHQRIADYLNLAALMP